MGRWAALAMATWDAEEEKEPFRKGYWLVKDGADGEGDGRHLRYDDVFRVQTEHELL